MTKLTPYLLSFILIFSSLFSNAQKNTNEPNQIIDSLKNLINTSNNDTLIVKSYVVWDNLIYASNPELDFELNNKIKALCKIQLSKKHSLTTNLFYQKQLSSAYNNLGLIYENQGKYPDALKTHQLALIIRKKIKSKKGIADSNSNMGNIYFYQGNYPQALKCHYFALSAREELADTNAMATSQINIGSTYYFQRNYTDALKFFNKALLTTIKLKDLNRIADCYNNIGSVYQSQNVYDLALINLQKALDYSTQSNNGRLIANAYSNLGVLYDNTAKWDQALKHHKASLEIRKALKDNNGIVSALINVSSLLLKQKQYKIVQSNLKEALAISLALGRKEYLKTIFEGMAKTDSCLSNFKSAFNNYKMYIIYRDSLINQENTKKTVQTQMQYEFDKQQTADSIKTTEKRNSENLIHQQEIHQQKIYTYGGIAGFGLMLVVAFVSFRAFKNKQKANIIIAQQKHIVEEKQKEVMDSIRYAKRIQMALLPSEKYIAQKINNFKN